MTRRGRAWRWLAGRPWTITLVLIVGGNVLAWRSDADQTRARVADDRHRDAVEDARDCRSTNRSRHELRDAIAVVLTDNLVEVATRPPDPERVERFRRGIIEDMEREFPDRDCGPLEREEKAE